MVPSRSERTTQISTNLSLGAKEALINYLQRNKDIFAWSPMDLIGVDPDIMEHNLHISTNAHSVKQKHRHFSLEKDKIVREEVQKLLEVKLVREV